MLRPKQWIKNGFVLAPLIFSGSFAHPRAVIQTLLATVLFSVAASATYVLNDVIDRDADARHPTKCRRPIASGALSLRAAHIMLGVLLTLVALSFAWSPRTAAVVVAYVTLNVAYTLRLKHIPVVDLFVLASGFVLRAFAGAVAIGVPLSYWMAVTTLCVSLYLAAVKRREELAGTGSATRSVLGAYTTTLLDRYALMSAVCAVVFYGLFVITVRPGLAVTVPFVLFGVFRYWYIVETTADGESPTETVWGDLPLIGTVVAWALLCVMVLSRH